MKIVHIIPGIDSSGGAERLVVQLASEMAKTEDVTLLTYRTIPSTSTYRKELSDKVKCLSLGKTKGFDMRVFFQLYKCLKRLNPEIVNAHLPASFLYLIFSILLLPRIKFVFTIHNLPTHEESRKWMVNIRKLLIRRKRLFVITLSAISGREMETYYGLRSSAVIPNGIVPAKVTEQYDNVKNEIQQLKMNEHTRVFINIARIDAIKNQSMLCEAVNRLQLKNHNVMLLIVGAPVDYISGSPLLKKIMDYPNVHFFGLKDNVGDYLACSDVFCLASLKEGLPLVVLEAMSLGLPIISTPVGGVPDVVQHNKNGYIAKDFSIESFMAVVEAYLAAPEDEIVILRNNNLNTFHAHYTITQTNKKYLSYYHSLIPIF